jgi:hypothetical protein
VRRRYAREREEREREIVRCVARLRPTSDSATQRCVTPYAPFPSLPFPSLPISYTGGKGSSCWFIRRTDRGVCGVCGGCGVCRVAGVAIPVCPPAAECGIMERCGSSLSCSCCRRRAAVTQAEKSGWDEALQREMQAQDAVLKQLHWRRRRMWKQKPAAAAASKPAPPAAPIEASAERQDDPSSTVDAAGDPSEAAAVAAAVAELEPAPPAREENHNWGTFGGRAPKRSETSAY